MKNYCCCFLLIIPFLLCITSCDVKLKLAQYNFEKSDLSNSYIIPQPVEISADSSAFALDQYTTIINLQSDSAYYVIANYLEETITKDLGIKFIGKNPKNLSRVIAFKSVNDNNTTEAYTLNIKKDSILINSSTLEGAFRAVQTLRQVIPNKSIDTLDSFPIWAIPTGIITDSPYYEYRGTMLDVARHFFTVEEVKSYIDILAYYKINVLHLHLSDDQGWRIEIKSWPKLAEIGGASEVGGGEGGFYTQEDYKDLVAYASNRFITIIPEIDMPGHTNAASVAYPILNGNGKKPEIYTGMRVGFSTFDTRKDTVYSFIDDVVREISAMTPGPYFHIGGDESHATKKNDYIYFINRVEKIVNKYGKQMIGWDEIATTDVSSNSISQFWQSAENAKLAKQKKLKVIMSPAMKAYLDMKYDSISKFGLKWAGFIPVDVAYNWHPESYIEEIGKTDILGVEAPLWSETISNLNELEYLAFPRLLGYAELGWSSPENRDWDNYKIRLGHQAHFFKSKNIDYFMSESVPWVKE